MKHELSKDMLDFIVDTLAASNISDLENAKQVIEQSGFSDEETAPVLEGIDRQLEELKAADNELGDVLDRKEVKDAIQAKVDEATADSNTRLTEANQAKDTAVDTLKTNTIDSIISYSLVLRKDSIDFENEDSSVSKLRDELSSRDQDALNESLTALSDEIKEKFSNTPSETLDNETNKENGQEEPGKTDVEDEEDKDEEAEAPSDMTDFLAKLVKSTRKK